MEAKGGLKGIVPMPGLPGAPRLRIGRVLLSRGVVNARHLRRAAALQETGASEARLLPGDRLGTILVRLGYVQPTHLVRALCDQAGMSNFLVFDRYLVEPGLTRRIPRGLAKVLGILPLVRLPGPSHLIACHAPPSPANLERLRLRLRGPVEPIVFHPDGRRDLAETIDACYATIEARGAGPARLGEVLVRDRLVAARDVEEALAESRRTGRPLGQVLQAWKLLSERVLYALLARQRGLPLVSAQAAVDPREAARFVRRLPRPYVSHNQVLPYSPPEARDTLVAVTSNPTLDTVALAEALGVRQVRLQLACRSELEPLVEETCRLAAA